MKIEARKRLKCDDKYEEILWIHSPFKTHFQMKCVSLLGAFVNINA